MTKLFNVISVVAILLVAACASGTTMVSAPAETGQSFSNVKIVAGDDTVGIDPKAGQRFEETLSNLLFGEHGRFSRGEGMTIKYRFIQYDEGSQVARYLIGLGAGKGELTTEITFLDSEGNEMAKIQAGGQIIGGLFGGSFTQAVDRAAMEAADYANENFAQ
ncbi:MAG: DUF4410 domain-containing protein [Pseudomonadota bacterium]